MKDELQDHVKDYDNPHKVTKGQIGLGDVDNTPDAKKPVSEPVQLELKKKVDAVAGKGLSTNDFSNTYKSVIDNLGALTSTEIIGIF